jgi:hypothetical protein
VIDAGLDLQGRLHPPVVYSRLLHLDSYRLVSREVARATGEEYDRMGSYQSFEYNPWTGFMHRAFSGRYLNVDAGGLYNIRRSTPAEPLREGQRDLLVWAFGGSTMFGWGMPDSFTIPSLLQRELSDRLPLRRVRVLNCGQAYYFSSQELAQYVAMLRVGERPQIVIFLDGLNETVRVPEGCEVPYFSDTAYRGWEEQRQERYLHTGSWLRLTGNFPLNRLRQHFAGTKDTPRDSRYIVPPGEPVNRTVENYRCNRDLIVAISARLGIDVYCFLQPLTAYGDYAHSPAQLLNGADIARAVYDTLVGEARSGRTPHFYTLHDVLFELEAPYVDSSHYSDTGSTRVAAAMATIIAGQQ